ncbi:MAG: radical SAM protein [Comamonadaceae bacterium]|nr:radical SAM protein [Comamonadaceae bacterium]
MTHHLDDDAGARADLPSCKPDIVGCTAITPAIYKAERLLQIAKEVDPAIVTVLGGIHGTFMYPQVLQEAPWIDAVVRGEGEQVFLNLVQRGRGRQLGAATATASTASPTCDGRQGRRHARPSRRSRTSTASRPTGASSSGTSTSTSRWARAWRCPNFARGCPFTCSFCSQWKFWRDYRIRDPKKVVDEIETAGARTTTSASSSSPTRNRRSTARSSSQFCEELIERDLGVLWGINTRVTDILRDEKLLPMFRKAGLIHVSLGTEAAAQLKLDRFNKETTIAQNKKAIQLLKDAGIVAEAQFIVGLENETAETLEETYRMAQDWKPDMANWCDVHAVAVLATCSRSSATRSRCSTSRSTTSSRRS